LDRSVRHHGFGLERSRLGDTGCAPLINRTGVIAGIRGSPDRVSM
jgi:hypothetical protein